MSTTTKAFPLHVAASAGDVAQIQKLVATVGVNSLDTKGWTALHYASSYQRPNAVKALIAAGANVNIADAQKRTPLHLAASSGDAASIKELLAAKADTTKQDHLGRTPETIARAYSKAAALTALTNTTASSGEHDLEFLQAYGAGRALPELPERDPNVKPRHNA